MSQRIQPLERPDSLHLQAAQGWLELGNHLEADKELDHIAPQLRTHPDVLMVRYGIYSRAGKWEACADLAAAIAQMLPEVAFGHLHLAYALHELKRTKEAWQVLLPVVDRFPEEYLMRYNLACYACQLGHASEAKAWLIKAFEICDKQKLKRMALDDPDLKPLWKEIGRL